MKTEDIRSKADSELDYELEKIKKELFDLHLKASTENIASPAHIQLLRRSIARILTIKHERRLTIRGQESR